MKDTAMPLATLIVVAAIFAQALTNGPTWQIAITGILVVMNMGILGLRLRDVWIKHRLSDDADTYGAHAA